MTVWVVFVDTDARRDCDEDLICGSERAAKAHMADLRKMGFDKPVFTIYPDEAAYYDKRMKKRGY